MKTGNVVSIALLWLAACTCHAQQVTLHVCRDARGATSYRDAPCADAGLREIAARTYVAPHDPPDAARRLEAIDRQVHAQWQHERWSAPVASRRRMAVEERASDGRDEDRRRCRAARAAVSRAMRSRRVVADRAALEEAAVDACFAL
jgi:hypothetical protein